MKARMLPLVFALLAACTPQQPTSSLPPQEVLNLAAQASQKLTSAQYLITADFDVDSGEQWTADGVLRMDGSLYEAGKQMHFQTDVTVDVDSTEENYTLSSLVEVTVLEGDEVYMKIHSLTSQPSSAMFNPQMIAGITGTWWQLPSQERSPETVSLSPDPALLQAQAQVITVTKDNGITELNGTQAYHYEVELNKEKLITYISQLAKERGQDFSDNELRAALQDMEATGEVWIDADTYFMHKFVWDITGLQYSQQGTADLSLTVTFRNHNSAQPIVPPTNWQPFTPAALFTLPSDALFEPEY